MFLPPHLAVLFKPRDPIPYLPPGKLSHEKKFPPYSGVANLVAHFENPQDTPPPHKIKTLEEYKEEKRRAKCLQTDEKLKEEIAKYKPKEAEGLTGDPFKTLFVARINYEVSESKLIREFEQFGRIKQGKLVYDRFSGKSRGYAFLEFEKEEDMLVAYREGDGMKIEGRRVLVDVERGRTVEGFLPRRLGGGLGATRKGKPEECVKHSGREPARLRSPDRRDSSRYHSDRRRSSYRDRDDPGYRGESRSSRSGHHRDSERDRDRGGRVKERERRRSRERERDRPRDRDRDRDRERDRKR